jgi:hypothetical protein
MYVRTYRVILTEVEKQGVKGGIGRLERMVAVQGFETCTTF